MDKSENNFKETKELTFNFTDKALPYFYNKTKKLVTALFMVTDIMDKEEPLRNKLRELGLEIMSDSYSNSSKTDYISIGLINKISLLLSFLDIASNIQIVSEMNGSILKKEFILFKEKIEGSTQNKNLMGNDLLLNFFDTEEEIMDNNVVDKDFSIGHIGQNKNTEKSYIRHIGQNKKIKGSIGIQKGSTLLNALKEIENKHTKNNNNSLRNSYDKNKDNSAKKGREEEIVKILKDHIAGLTITDIKSFSEGELKNLSDKTLQRELVYLLNKNVLYKVGEKRWSRYFVK